jgi:AraC-like DNA-binding protein
MGARPSDMSIRLHDLPPPYSDCNILTWEPGRRMDAHQHGFLQCIHVLAGVLEVDWGAGPRSLDAGKVHILPPGHTHRLYSPGGQHQFGLNFAAPPRGEDQRGLLATLLAACTQPMVHELPLDPDLEALLHDDRTRLRPASRLQLAHLLDRYCLDLLALLDAPRALADRLVDQLDHHRHGPITVASMAADLGVARATLQRACRERFGCGVAHLHERLRLQRAARLLLTTHPELARCAEACGYTDVARFAKAFRRVHGASPGRWRDAKRQRQG